jgi:hypothetical protein
MTSGLVGLRNFSKDDARGGGAAQFFEG